MAKLDNQQMGKEGLDVGKVYTLTEIDIPGLLKIEQDKLDLLGVIDEVESEEVQREMLGLLSKMQVVMEKKFSRKGIENYSYIDDEGTAWTFYDFKDGVLEFDEPDDLRWIAERAFNIYDHFITRIGGAIPTERVRAKKRFLGESSASLI